MLFNRELLRLFSNIEFDQNEKVFEFPTFRVTLGPDKVGARVLTVVHRLSSRIEVWSSVIDSPGNWMCMTDQLGSEDGQCPSAEELLWMLRESQNLPADSTQGGLINPLVESIARLGCSDVVAQSMKIGANLVGTVTIWPNREVDTKELAFRICRQAAGEEKVERVFNFVLTFDHQGENPIVQPKSSWRPESFRESVLPFLTALEQLELAMLLRRLF